MSKALRIEPDVELPDAEVLQRPTWLRRNKANQQLSFVVVLRYSSDRVFVYSIPMPEALPERTATLAKELHYHSVCCGRSATGHWLQR